MDKEQALREHLLYVLREGEAHISVEEALGCSRARRRARRGYIVETGLAEGDLRDQRGAYAIRPYTIVARERWFGYAPRRIIRGRHHRRRWRRRERN